MTIVGERCRCMFEINLHLGSKESFFLCATKLYSCCRMVGARRPLRVKYFFFCYCPLIRPSFSFPFHTDCGRVSDKKLLQHGERSELRKVGNVQPVIFQYEIDTAVALVAREGEEVHGLISHAHEQRYLCRFHGLQKIVVPGLYVGETSAAQVEERVAVAVLEVGIETHEAREVHHVYNVEVGERAVTRVEPHYAVHNVLEQCGVVLLASRGEISEFRHEQCDGQLVRVERNGAQRARH